MTERLALKSLSPDQRERLLNRPSPLSEDVQVQVAPVLDEVFQHGDAALRAFTQRFDGVLLEQLTVPKSEFQRAFDTISTRLKRALGQVKLNLERFHEPQCPCDYELEPMPGVTLGQRTVAHDRVGIYVPKNLVSSLLMAAVPARLAGVCTLAVCTPPQADGSVSPAVLAAAALLDVEELYPVGGAQAIAALAYGTETIAKVDKIVGPGNAYVTAAKALLRDEVGIDLLAGPSEILLVVEPVTGLDSDTLTVWVLAELRAQLEHGPATSALLLTSMPGLADAVAGALQPDELRERNVAVLHHDDIEAALSFVNDYAPEHLGLWGEAAERLWPKIRNAGSVFVGAWSPVALGDYASGTNHILPTARLARFGQGLGVRDFVKTISYQRIDPDGLVGLADAATTLAEHEGLPAHAESVRVRIEGAHA